MTETLANGYSYEYEYPFARVSVIFFFFLHIFALAKLATSSIRVKPNKSDKHESNNLKILHYHQDYEALSPPGYMSDHVNVPDAKRLNLRVFMHRSTTLKVQVNLDMTDHCTTDFCIWRTICLVPVQCISSIRHMYTTDFAYDGPIFLVPLTPSYPSSPVYYILYNSYLNGFDTFP